MLYAFSMLFADRYRSTMTFTSRLHKYVRDRNVIPERILNVNYAHKKLKNGDDLYVTHYGLPFYKQLDPYNFLTDKEWFRNNSVRLSGSSTTYKVTTKKIRNISKVFVIKYNRMGQEIPGSDESSDLINAEFNSPFEEFSLVMELKQAKNDSPCSILTQKPLAIYVPSERIDLWRMGRIEYKLQPKLETHRREVELDMFRAYVVIYEWIEGVDAAHACTEEIIDEEQMVDLTREVEKQMKLRGFVTKDSKPHHIIIRPGGKGLLKKDGSGDALRAVIDYELLARTPEKEEMIRKLKRVSYLRKQKDRFIMREGKRFPPHLREVNLFGVDFVYGRAESTGGLLWVVGFDFDLFDYFLPERWENTPQTKLSTHHEIFHTLTKDNINLVWKVSRVGTIPDMDPYHENERNILEYGYNSPFEEVAYSLELAHTGIRTVYPRAIYMYGATINISESILDNSRFDNHEKLKTPEGDPILRGDHNYIIIWGYWNGLDEKLAVNDGDYLEGINALSAFREGIISRDEYISLLKRKEERLRRAGFEDLHLRGSHVLLSLDSRGRLVKDPDGIPEMRICNFELIKKLPFSKSSPESPLIEQ
jgi:hypothetical protein